MNRLKKVKRNQWPKANYCPLIHINLEPNYFVEKLGLDFFIECDDLAECENSLLKLERVDGDVYFALFKYINIEQGVNVLCDQSTPEISNILQEILISLGVDSEYVTISKDIN